MSVLIIFDRLFFRGAFSFQPLYAISSDRRFFSLSLFHLEPLFSFLYLYRILRCPCFPIFVFFFRRFIFLRLSLSRSFLSSSVVFLWYFFLS